MKLPDGSGLHAGAHVAQRTEDERARRLTPEAAETVAWALRRGELTGLKRALLIIDNIATEDYLRLPSELVLGVHKAIVKLEAELEAKP